MSRYLALRAVDSGQCAVVRSLETRESHTETRRHRDWRANVLMSRWMPFAVREDAHPPNGGSRGRSPSKRLRGGERRGEKEVGRVSQKPPQAAAHKKTTHCPLITDYCPACRAASTEPRGPSAQLPDFLTTNHTNEHEQSRRGLRGAAHKKTAHCPLPTGTVCRASVRQVV